MAAKILVVGPSWIGDMVMAQSLCKTLRKQNPDVIIDVLAPGWSLPVIARMPEVREGIELPFSHGQFDWPGRHRLGKSLRSKNYDRAIVIPRSFKASLVPFHAGIPVRTGYRGEMRFGLINDMRELNKSKLSTTVTRFVALGLDTATPLPDPLPHPRLNIDQQNQATLLQRLQLDNSGRVVGLMPGAEYGEAKQWPVARFAELAVRLNADGIAVWVFGSEKDRPLGEVIAKKARLNTRNLCGETSIVDAIDLIALTDRVVSNDSGLMHIAAASGTRVVAIYGSSSPEFTPPLTNRSAVIWLNLDCSPCFDRRCRFGHYNCLREISPDSVQQVLTDLQ